MIEKSYYVRFEFEHGYSERIIVDKNADAALAAARALTLQPDNDLDTDFTPYDGDGIGTVQTILAYSQHPGMPDFEEAIWERPEVKLENAAAELAQCLDDLMRIIDDKGGWMEGNFYFRYTEVPELKEPYMKAKMALAKARA